MKVAVTGGSGQLGTPILRRLLRDRSITRVVAIDLRPPLVPKSKTEVVITDVRDPQLHKYLSGCDALIHLAFVVTQQLPRTELEDINIRGTQEVFYAAVRAGVHHVLWASSIAAYGVLPGHPVPIAEDTPRRYQPEFAYAACKFELEAFIDRFSEAQPQIVVTRMRPAILIGERMEHSFGQMLRRRLLLDVGMRAPLPIVWDEDVADAFILALKARQGGAFNLAADDPLPVSTLARRANFRLIRVPLSLARLGESLVNKFSQYGLGRASDPAWLDSAGTKMIISSERARRVLGWQPRHPTCAAVIQHFVETVPHRLDHRLATFLYLVGISSERQPPMHELSGFNSQVHLRITGARGGECSLAVKDSRLRLSWDVPRPPTAVITLSAPLLLDLINGRADFGTAQFTGKIRVEGEANAVHILAGIVAIFRNQATSRKDIIGRLVSHALLEYLSDGGTR